MLDPVRSDQAMGTVRVQCTSCEAQFERDARFVGQSVRCPNCKQRLTLPNKAGLPVTQAARPASASASRIQGRSREVVDMPLGPEPSPTLSLAQFLSASVLGFVLGGVCVGGCTSLRSYSSEAYERQVARADRAEAKLSELTASEKEAKRQAAATKFALSKLRKESAELRMAKGVPDWASPEKWSKSNAELGRLRQQNSALERQLAVRPSVPKAVAVARSDTTDRRTNYPWYADGALHKATMREWRRATYANKLATAADFGVNIMRAEGMDVDQIDINGKPIRTLADTIVQALDTADRELQMDDQQVAEVLTLVWFTVKAEWQRPKDGG